MREGGLLLSAVALAACIAPPRDDTPPRPPPPPALDAGTLALDAGPPPPSAEPLYPWCRDGSLGSPCERTCESLRCYTERLVPIAIEEGGATRETEHLVFEHGLCSSGCGSDEDCGSCAVCVDHVAFGRARLRGPLGTSGLCRPRCGGTIGCRPGQICDATLGACVDPACRTDADCEVVEVDRDGDGRGDALALDPVEGMVCAWGACVDFDAVFGGACLDDGGCEPGRACVRHPAWDAGRAGACALSDCDAVACGPAGVCSSFDGERVCTRRCTAWADEEEAIVGRDGHGAGCDPAFRCSVYPDGDRCEPASYNDVAELNVGAPCERDDECYSPYGRGRCLKLNGSWLGICALEDCEAEAIEAICDASAGLHCTGSRFTARERCIRRCTTPDDCLPGTACVLLRDTFDRTVRACVGQCSDDTHCRASEHCAGPDGEACRLGDRACVCTPLAGG